MKPAGSRIKGSIGEREIVKAFTDAGIPARRVPLSGAAAEFPGDVLFKTCHCYEGEHGEFGIRCACGEERIEVKRRSQGFKRIYQWLEDNFMLAFRGDRKEWLVTLRLEDLIALIKER